MAVATGPDEITRLQTADLRHHQGQQRVAGDVERHAQKNIGAALIKLTRQFSIGHIELEQRMTRHQRHLVQLAHVPGRDDQAPRIGRAADLLDQLCNLVDVAAIRRGPVAPLLAIHRAKIAVGIGPFVPDANAVFLQIGDVGVAAQEPQQLDDDRLQVQLLGRHQRKALRQIEAHLVAEDRAGAGAGAVGFCGAFVQHLAHQVQIRLHVRRLWCRTLRGDGRPRPE